MKTGETWFEGCFQQPEQPAQNSSSTKVSVDEMVIWIEGVVGEDERSKIAERFGLKNHSGR